MISFRQFMFPPSKEKPLKDCVLFKRGPIFDMKPLIDDAFAGRQAPRDKDKSK